MTPRTASRYRDWEQSEAEVAISFTRSGGRRRFGVRRTVGRYVSRRQHKEREDSVKCSTSYAGRPTLVE